MYSMWLVLRWVLQICSSKYDLERNLANADSVSSSAEETYKARHAVFGAGVK